MTKILFLAFLVILAHTQQLKQYLPKSGRLPMTTIFSYRMSLAGDNDFYLNHYENDRYISVISSYPVRPNSVTKVTFMLVRGRRILLGCGRGHMSDILNSQFAGQLPQTIGYHPNNGAVYNQGVGVRYASTADQGDNITMTIDLRPFQNKVSFARNGLDMGVAASGIDNWNTDIYIYLSIVYADDRIRITDYYVSE